MRGGLSGGPCSAQFAPNNRRSQNRPKKPEYYEKYWYCITSTAGDPGQCGLIPGCRRDSETTISLSFPRVPIAKSVSTDAMTSVESEYLQCCVRTITRRHFSSIIVIVSKIATTAQQTREAEHTKKRILFHVCCVWYGTVRTTTILMV